MRNVYYMQSVCVCAVLLTHIVMCASNKCVCLWNAKFDIAIACAEHNMFTMNEMCNQYSNAVRIYSCFVYNLAALIWIWFFAYA